MQEVYLLPSLKGTPVEELAREKKIPYLGLCYGMQLAVIAFARDVLGWKDANTEENNKSKKHAVIHLMPAQKEFIDPFNML